MTRSEAAAKLTDEVLESIDTARHDGQVAFHRAQHGAVYDEERVIALRHAGWDAARAVILDALGLPE